MKKYYLVSTDHLEENLWFRDDEDFIVGMNHVAIQVARCPEILMLAFILMSNHVHFVMYGTYSQVHEFAIRFKARYSQYYSRKWGAKNILRRNRIDIREIQVGDEALERNVAYVQMNCVAASICAHPTQYRWGTGNLFFKGIDNQQSARPLSSFSRRAREKMLHSECADIPGDWLVADAGYVLPQSYVATDAVERLFRTPARMNYFLNSSSKARKRIEVEKNLPAFRDQVILQALPDLCQSLFQKPDFQDLSTLEKTEFLRQILFRFSSNVNQVARVCGLTYADAARLLDTA